MQISRFKGLNNTTTPERFELGELDIARNVELDDRGRLRRRTGIRRLATGSTHSLYSTGEHLFGVRSQALSHFTAAGWTTIRNLASNEPMSFAHLLGRTYFCNGVEMGVLDGVTYRDFGVPVPAQQPVAVATAGSLPPGRYQYALTFEIEGQEGGTNNAGVIELASSGGIDFSMIEAAPTGAVKSLYVSAANGEAMYRVAEMSAGESTFRLQSDDFRGRQLRTQFCSRPPVGNMVRVWNGVTYIVVGDAVFYSRPFEFELFDLAHRFMQFGETVTMFEPLHSGIYVGTPTRVYWMAGESPEKFQLNEASASGAVLGSAAQVSAADMLKGSDDRHGQNARPAAVWTSTAGVFSGYDGGQAINITERAYRIPEAIRGVAFVRNESGFSQYLTALQGVVSPIDV